MKHIHLPKKLRTVADREPTAALMLLELVMTRVGWRSSIEATRAALAISDKLEQLAASPGGLLIISDREHELLQAETRLEGFTITPPAANRNYLAIVEAIHDAKAGEAPS